jgi:hypothetical protein
MGFDAIETPWDCSKGTGDCKRKRNDDDDDYCPGRDISNANTKKALRIIQQVILRFTILLSLTTLTLTLVIPQRPGPKLSTAMQLFSL